MLFFGLFYRRRLNSRVEPFHCAKTQRRFDSCACIAGQLVNISMVGIRLKLAFPKSSIRFIGQNYHCSYFVSWIFGGLKIYFGVISNSDTSSLTDFYPFFSPQFEHLREPSNAHWIVLVVLVLSLVLIVSVNWGVKAQPSPVVQSVCWEHLTMLICSQIDTSLTRPFVLILILLCQKMSTFHHLLLHLDPV